MQAQKFAGYNIERLKKPTLKSALIIFILF